MTTEVSTFVYLCGMLAPVAFMGVIISIIVECLIVGRPYIFTAFFSLPVFIITFVCYLKMKIKTCCYL